MTKTSGLILALFASVLVLTVSACSENKPVADKPAEQAAPAATEQTVTVDLPTMKCNTCSRHIQSALTKVAGVSEVNVDMDAKKATIKFISAKIDQAKIEHVIAESGYDANGVKRNAEAYEKLPECCK